MGGVDVLATRLQVFCLRHEKIVYEAVEFCRNRQAGGRSQAVLSEVVTVGSITQQLFGDGDTGVLQGTNQETGAQEIAGKREGFLCANILKTAAFMAQDDVAQLTGKRVFKLL